ncbi:MAG: SDR family NAD(P)-dependent oxidoreductase, partial [Alphaproteobacteria bacterium]
MSTPPSLSRSLQGSIAHVTGAGSGMGRATAEIFGAEGAHVAVTD